MGTMAEVLAWVGGLGLTSATIAGASYAFFRFFGARWLESKFDQNLERLKHDQNTELQRFRLEVDSLLDRSTKLNQRELEVLPEIWVRLNEAFGSIVNVVHPYQEFPDVDRATEGELEEILQEEGFKEFEKEEIRSLKKKSDRFQQIRFWKRLNRANGEYNKFNHFYITNSIFLTDETKGKIDIVRSMMNAAVTEARIEKETDSSDKRGFKERHKERTELLKDGKELLGELEKDIRHRLWQWRDEVGAIRLLAPTSEDDAE